MCLYRLAEVCRNRGAWVLYLLRGLMCGLYTFWGALKGVICTICGSIAVGWRGV